METIDERIEMYENLEKQIDRNYGMRLDEVMELMKIGEISKDYLFISIGYAYALGFKKGRNCEKNKARKKRALK